jgi:uncharacterized glyoxalase superfamily protein PhnB
MSEPYPTAIPMISYEDGAAAIDWLVRVFGFEERSRMLGDDGRVSHAELRIGEGVIFLATPTAAYQSPTHHAEICETARLWQQSPWVIDGVLIFVENLDDHYRNAKAGGAVILSELEDGFPGPRYRVLDCEGHRWMFMHKPTEGDQKKGDKDI